MRRCKLLWLKFCAPVLIICGCANLLLAQPHYQLMDLGSMGGDTTYGIDINNKGEVAGFGNVTNGGQFHAFRTKPNQPINPATDDLGTKPGYDTYVTGINDAGTVIGRLQLSGLSHAMRVPAGRVIDPLTDDLGTLGGQYSEATGINSSGQISGISWPLTGGNDFTRGFRTPPSRGILATDQIGTLTGGTYSRAYGINDSGQVVGFS